MNKRLKTSWRQKLERVQEARLVEMPENWIPRYGPGNLLIPRPLDVDALIRRIRLGEITTISRLREKLAADAGAQAACPLTTGIFIRIVAEAAEEDRVRGENSITRIGESFGAMAI